ncbi:MBL fold metallo-hydrolase RNA specificity domain-containing protein [Dyadobacter fermentans]|uniref:Beta-lactamase domain protein n=1 Tax=Dyadobacter fermentans (strain ATCC 700827 / DSM 18053 / CIP 107007 / KCTC 52180 / NS114) TaxID=471854 RepID=C6VWB7_DYAFD|nr:MBL fold metallo-hydrolase [Dyadobacter fermentans]ACT94948.1 beta-lactamase domain protein [Dyadobacter fermentans DSM 18053]
MLIQFFGAARTVTGSKHLITTEKGTKVLLDCGLFQGIQTDEFNQEFGFKPADVDYVILSHAHIDHSGLLPRLVRKGFKGPIYCTAATADLCRVMLLDSAHIQEKDLERINKRRQKQGRPLLEELYNAEDAAQALSLLKTVRYGQTFFLGEENEISVFLTDAAHLLGSAAVHLSIPDGGTFKQVTFTGDIGRPEDRILRKPEPFPQADYIICESTYGDRLHEKEIDMHAHLLRIVQETCVRRRGKLIIPAFAIDRTQELIYALDQLSSSGQLPQIPVYIDSPLAIRATAIMKEHDECFNPEILEYIEKDGDAFAFPYLNYISDVQESIALNDRKEPCIIISASGMAEAGRIKHHIKNNIGDPDSTILLVGYASANTLAGALKRGDRQVNIFGERLDVKCRVETMDSFSGHGDYSEMLDFLSCQTPERVKEVFLVHGEYETQVAFKLKLEKAGFRKIHIPALYEGVKI